MKARSLRNTSLSVGLFYTLFFLSFSLSAQLTSTTYIGGGVDATDWNDAANWTNGAPDDTKEAIITLDATFNNPLGIAEAGRIFIDGGTEPTVNFNINIKVFTNLMTSAPAVEIGRGELVVGSGAVLDVEPEVGERAVLLSNGVAKLTNGGTIVLACDGTNCLRLDANGSEVANNGTMELNGTTQTTLAIRSGCILGNTGTLSLPTGKQFPRVNVQSGGQLLNFPGGKIDMANGRIRVLGNGSIINGGLLEATIDYPLVVSNNAINNGFYRYGNAPRLFAQDVGGAGGLSVGTDDGIDLNDVARTSLDAGGTRMVKIGNAGPYSFFDGLNQVGTSQTDGNMTFNVDAVLSGDPVTLTATIQGEVISILVSNVQIVLPVEWTYFTANAVSEGVALKWGTATESENDYFSVERSTDGRSFEPIRRVQGSGTTLSPRDYQWIDRDAPRGRIYYRLRQVDFDGTFDYSDVVSVVVNRYSAEEEWTLYPTLVNSATPLTINLENSYGLAPGTAVSARVISAAGRVERTVTLVTGQLHTLNVADLPSGLYALQLTGGDKRQTLPFQVR